MIDVNDRLTERINRARLQLEVRRAAGPFFVLLVGLGIGLACAVWLVTNVSKTAISSTRVVSFVVDDANAVVAGRNQVRFRGIPAGQVTDVDLVDHRAVVTVKIQKKFGPVYRNATAALQQDTPLEDMHLDIKDRGDRAAGEADEDHPLDPSRTSTRVQVEDVLDTFQPEVRDRLRSLLANLGNGLDGRGVWLQTAFAELTPLLRASGRLTSQLAERDHLVRRLVRNSARLTTELGSRDKILRTVVREGGATFGTLRTERASLDGFLHELPPTLQGADDSLAAVDGILGDTDTAVQRLRPVADAIPTALSGIEELSDSLGPAAKKLRTPVRRLTPLSDALRPLSQQAGMSFKTLLPQVPVLNRTFRNLAGCKEGISQFFLFQPTVGPFDDKRGPMLRADVQASAAANGLTSTPRRKFAPTCSGGRTIPGRPATETDMG